MSQPDVFKASIRSYLETQRCGCRVRVWHVFYYRVHENSWYLVGQDKLENWATAMEYVCGTLKASNRDRS
ncbi:hypothetical protein ACFYY5_29085 [Nocardia elegans]|uniref:Transposase n=1 Tax=Nocardia elegans TaxID=300029 RepID=A0ABW6TL98_9NOCA